MALVLSIRYTRVVLKGNRKPTSNYIRPGIRHTRVVLKDEARGSAVYIRFAYKTYKSCIESDKSKERDAYIYSIRHTRVVLKDTTTSIMHTLSRV